MTKAEIIAAVRSLVNEKSTDAGALLEDTGNLLGFVEDACEQVVLDLLDAFPNELLAYEDVSMEAGIQEYELETKFYRILKIEKTVSGENPTEIDQIDPLSRQYVETHGETTPRPIAANIINGILMVFPTPLSAITNYIRVWGIQAEVTPMDDDGPAYLPTETHRLIVFWAAGLVAVMLGVNPAPYHALYQNRLLMILKNQRAKFQQAPRFVRESVVERTTRDEREKAFFDKDWP